MVGVNVNLLYKYKNGNCLVELFDDGTRTIEFPDEPKPDFPFNLDVKITNYCDGPCQKWCHEQSNKKGVHADLEHYLYLFDNLPKGIELAIGGGNTISHPNLIWFLKELKKRDLVANVTVNQYHIESPIVQEIIDRNLIAGLGCSVTDSNFQKIPKYKNLVFHLILGIHDINTVNEIKRTFPSPKILFLGYKDYGNGVKFRTSHNDSINANIRDWYNRIATLLGKENVSFDNLAIEQVGLKRLFKDEDWKTFYQGDDGTTSMYVDLVTGQYACTSRSQDKYSIENQSLKGIFQASKHRARRRK